MRTIDNVLHAISEALVEGLDLSRLAVTAWHAATVTKLDAAVVRALGLRDPELRVDDVLPRSIFGTVPVLVAERSFDKRGHLTAEDMAECEAEYLDLLQRASGSNSEEFMRNTRIKIRAAIRLSISARLNCITLEDRLRMTPIGESLSFVTEVADYYRDYRKQCALMDAPDVLVTELEKVEACQLCLIDRRGLPPLGAQALRRLLPNAFFCTVSV